MTGRMSRNKGSGYERELVKQIGEHLGISLSRTPRSGAWEHARGDIYGLPGYHVEAKRGERPRIDEWYRQAEGDCPEDVIPILVYRKSRSKSKVVLDLEDFLNMLKEIYAYQVDTR